MKKFFESICDTFRLIIAALITLFVFVTFLYLLPIHDIPNILPDYLIETTKDLTTTQKKVVDQLYLNGKLTDPKGLYGEIIEYYHFLVFLVFALLAMVGGFVYLQIRHETTAKINAAIKEGIREANLEGKIQQEIERTDIPKKIEEVIDEQAVGDTVMEAILNSDDYLRQLTEVVGANLETDITLIEDEITQLREGLGSAVGGIDEELEKIKADLDRIKTQLQGGE